jgi:hypothetical protein
MKNFNKALSLVTAALLTMGFNTTAADSMVDLSKMQRYSFTYHFNKAVDPVIKLTHQTQQHIAYQLVNDIQTSAHYGINYSGKSLVDIEYGDTVTLAFADTQSRDVSAE